MSGDYGGQELMQVMVGSLDCIGNGMRLLGKSKRQSALGDKLSL